MINMMRSNQEIIDRYYECDRLMGVYLKDTTLWYNAMYERKILGWVLGFEIDR